MLAFDLTTHEGHFMGRSKNRLILFEEDTQGLYAWGSGSLSQLNLTASLRALPAPSRQDATPTL